jgi:hypothetical protein
MLTEKQKTIARKFSRQRGQSFPNGSSYTEEYLTGDGVEVIYNVGYRVVAEGEDFMVSFDAVGVGGGVDLGEYFCNRNQALANLVAGDKL